MAPVKVTNQESTEIEPTAASLAGSIIIPDPNMLTIVMIVNWKTLIFIEKNNSCIIPTGGI